MGGGRQRRVAARASASTAALELLAAHLDRKTAAAIEGEMIEAVVAAVNIAADVAEELRGRPATPERVERREETLSEILAGALAGYGHESREPLTRVLVS